MIKQKKRSGLFYCLIAVGILLLSLNKAQAQALVPTPGGVTNPNYTWAAWLTPENYSSGAWINLITSAEAVGNFYAPQNAPVLVNSGYNFHPAVNFPYSGSNANAIYRLFSTNGYTINASDNVTTIFVLKRSTDNNSYDHLIGFSNSYTNSSIAWYSQGTTISESWGGSRYGFGDFTEGIISIDNANNASNGFYIYKNGVYSTVTATATSSRQAFTNQKVAIASGDNSTNNGYYGYEGTIQEIIILKGSDANNHVNPDDMQKIHSYLAIKYGITLGAGDYVNSDGTPVWTRNTSYNSNIFGIGRDKASGLNQVQSQSVGSSIFTIYKGTLGILNDNNSDQLTDKSFLMLGSNGSTSYNMDYIYPIGSPFKGGSSTEERLDYCSQTIYKAQVTTGGVSGGSQTVNIKVNVPTDVRYVLVSNNSAFEPSNTYIYPVKNGIASNVSISDGDFITYAGFMSKPGGVDMDNYTLDLWVDGNNSTNSSWSNLAPANYTLGKFSTNAPVIRNSKFNYQQELYFGNTNSSKLGTTSPYNLVSGNSYYVFVVSDDAGVTNNPATLLTFNSSGSASFQWQNGTSTSSRNNILISNWNTTTRSPGFNDTNFPRYGIATMNVVNSSGGALNMYLNGALGTSFTLAASGAGGPSTNTGPVLIGTANTTTGTANTAGFSGSIQEVILMRNSSAALPPADINRIQTYLAVKYGITLSTDYLNSLGTTVWSRSDNSDYNNNIFGIGRDDNSGLYQKQSHSVTNSTMVAYVGNLATLNNDNTGTLGDLQYLMFGSNNQPSISGLNDSNVADGIEYSNGKLASVTGFNIQSAVYKTQLTGTTSMEVNLQAPSNDFTYLLVSSDESFKPSQTSIYQVNKRLVQNLEIAGTYSFFKFVGFSPGPGGVNPGLRLWLRADDDAELTIDNLPLTDSKLIGYPNPIDPDNIPAVSVWRDLVRAQTYSYDQGAIEGAHKIPVMEYHSPEMNYYPAVRFWGSSTSYGSYLANTQGILPTALPLSGGHTAIFMVNNNFSSNPWIYTLMFGSATANVYNGPGYGVEKTTGSNSIMAGRYRSGTAVTGTVDLFQPGSTSILSYIEQTTNPGGSNNPLTFRFNGKEDKQTASLSTFDMTAGSQLGKGYTYDRTIQGYMSEVIIYDRVLLPEETQKVESYLALKYGVTLRPSNTGTNRFDYLFSDNTPIWSGDTGGGIFADYYNNISAVIRDDAARLYNSHSHSTNLGSLLHVGVAGTVLSADGSGTGELNDMEAVAFGNDGATGNTSIGDGNNCGSFTDRFNRKWLIHKITQDDRPITLLIGAQNNGNLTFGKDTPTTNDYYNKLNAGYDITLIVGNSPADIEAGNYKAVIPMSFINGEFQCSYTFTAENTYITFGWKANKKGCLADEDTPFTGDAQKTFYWNAWTSSTNRVSNPTTITVNAGNTSTALASYFDLGDDILVTGTSTAYSGGARTTVGYPRSGSTPEKGSLEVRRSGGVVSGSDVVVNITFNHPVIPEFSISGLGSYGSYNYEQVDVSGECSGGTYLPVLSYATDASKASYTIAGSMATVNKRGSVSGSSANGRVNVAFQGGVTSITIKFRTVGVKTAGAVTQSIYITPITLRPVPPPPPINEDQLSFVKQVKSRNITTCEPAVYSFYIGNYNCDSKVVNFSDTLPEHMKWQIDAIGLDAVSSALNDALSVFDPQISSDGRILQIDNLYVPGQSVSDIGLILTATAVLDEDALDKDTPYGEFNNRAAITYNWTLNSKPSPSTLMSLDRQTLADYTSFTAEWQQRQEMVELTPSYSKKTYKENDEITVTYTLNNPNDDLTGMYLDVNFNEEFTYVPGSFQATSESAVTPEPILMALDPAVPSTLTIAGSADGIDGFTLPAGQTTITFKLKAPTAANLVEDVDDEGNPTGEKVDLDIMYAFSSDMDDPCAILTIQGLQGDHLISYSKGRDHIISNRQVTMEIK